MAHRKKSLICISLFLILLTPALSNAGGQPETKSRVTSAAYKWLTDVLNRSAESLKKEAKQAADHTAQVRSSLAETTAKLQEMQTKIAILKAGMEAETLPAPVIGEILNTFSANEQSLSSRLDTLTGEIKDAEKRKAKQDASRSAIDAQIQILKSMKQSGAWSDKIQSAYDKYTQACTAFADASGGLISTLTQKERLLNQEKELLVGVLPRLKILQQAFIDELLQRSRTEPLGRQLGDLLRRIFALPGQAWVGFSWWLDSGQIQAFLLKTWAPLIGLLFFIVFLGWATRRLKNHLELMMEHVYSDTREIGVRMLISLACSLIATAYPIVFILWLTTAYAVLGLFEAVPALILLYILAGLTALAVFIRVIKDLFCRTGAETSCVPHIKSNAAPSFCRSLKAYGAYGIMGFVFTKILGLDRFPIPLKLLVNQIYGIGALLWTCLLLRPGYLQKIIDLPVSPRWTKLLRSSWTALLLLPIFVCFMELLGFQSFSIYAIHAAVLTEAVIAGVALLAVTGKGILKEFFEHEHMLHQSLGSLNIQVRQFYLPARLVFSALLIAGLTTGLLWAWGVGITSLAALMDHLSKGVNLGSLHLSPLNILACVFILYVVSRGSSFCKTVLHHRVFPRTGWDLGIQYSIATLIQYMIIIAGVLLAMNILGFPLASLALLAGAMGLGAGLGLQNVIANFVSGLVLLFERPVKVGDMLVVDGQWGEVKAIKIRSTVFQTFDHSVLIIPNSDLLSAKIVNWTHFGVRPNRLTLEVGVSYSSDVKMVTRLLEDICRANPLVSTEPAPRIYFQAYGDSSLHFVIQVFVRTPSDRFQATHEINTAIFETFREKGIEIPFPQRDLHIIDERQSSTNGEAQVEKTFPDAVQIRLSKP